MKLANTLIFLASLTTSSLIFADQVPVIDAYQSSNAMAASAPAPITLSVDQRVTVLERQIANFKQQLSQLNDLQQQLQELRGQLDNQQHDLKTLQDQVRNQYQDLDQRLSAQARKPAVHNTAPAIASTANSQENTGTDTASSAEQTAYQAAFNLLKNKKYPQAAVAFKKFIQQYPASQNLVSADYFLGQIYLLQGQPDKAIAQFNTILRKYAKNAKIPDTLLQLGLAYYAQGDLKQAKAQFIKVQQKYPDTAAAKSAQNRLRQIQQTAMESTPNPNNVDSSN